MKWSGVGTAASKSLWFLSLGRSSGEDVMWLRAALSKRWAHVEPAVGLAPVDAVKVVHDVAAADDEHAPSAQRRRVERRVRGGTRMVSAR